jgi:Asp/Glu/hydantoin racemase
MASIAFLHTSDAHVPTFRALLAEIEPAAEDVHLVDEELLSDARKRGVDAELERQILRRLRELAVQRPAVIVCTCSTLSGSAEGLAREVGLPVLRIDRPLAERAVANGGRIAIVATVESTLAPTRALFEECAAQTGSEAVLIDAPCVDAWQLFERGDHAGYLERVARHVRGLVADEVDVIVLAQASMAPIADLVGDLAVPVLSSPRLAVLRAVELAQR